MGVIQSTSIKIQVLAFRTVYLKIFFSSRLVVDRWLLNIYVSVKGALGAWLGWGQSFLVLLFPLSEGPENDYFIRCLNYLVSRSPTDHPVGYYGGTEAEQLFLCTRQRNQEPYLSWADSDSPQNSIQTVTPLSRLLLPSPKEARGLPGPPSSTDTALYYWVNSPGRQSFIFLNGLYSSKSGSVATTASALLTGWFSLLRFGK